MSYTVIDKFLPDAIENMLEQQFQYHTQWNYVSETSGNEDDQVDKQNKEIKQCLCACYA